MYPHERALVKRYAGRPFALVGVNSDRDLDKIKGICRTEKITWSNFRQTSTRGPIPTAWNVKSWPTVYVIDHKGIIRYKNVRGQSLDAAVDKLMTGMAGGGGQPPEKSTDK